MKSKKSVLALIGSASPDSSNHRLAEYVATQLGPEFTVNIFENLKSLPPFDPQLSSENTPDSILDFRQSIAQADGILICTPEYIFSIPSCLKNALEWCVSTTVFTVKPLGIVTASAHGQKGHEELKLIMSTLQAVFTKETTLLIPGIKGKIDKEGTILHEKTKNELITFTTSFKDLIQVHTHSRSR